MVTCRCITCGKERLLDPLEQPSPCCSEECEQEFLDVVHNMLDEGSLADQGFDPNTEFSQRAIAEAKRVKYRLARDAYDARADEVAYDMAQERERARSRSEIVRRYRGW
jgi:hypothetical protein